MRTIETAFCIDTSIGLVYFKTSGAFLQRLEVAVETRRGYPSAEDYLEAALGDELDPAGPRPGRVGNRVSWFAMYTAIQAGNRPRVAWHVARADDDDND